MPNDHDIWQWQEPNTAWKGAGLYHVTLKIPTCEPLLGELVIPNKDPKRAYVKYSDFGRVLLDIQRAFPTYHPEIQVLHYCLMPDHLHSVWYVRRKMKRGIKSAVQGFWLAAKKLGRAYSYYTTTDSRDNFQENARRISRENYQENALRNTLGNAAYYALSPIFTNIPHIRPMGQRRQLPATNHYVDMNPQRLATMRLMPGFFRVQDNIEIGSRTYSGVGKDNLLHAIQYATVHVSRDLVNLAKAGNDQPLRDYMNGCVIAARKGVVMVSPFISKQEQAVMVVLLKEHLPFIYLADNGFRDYYKPSDALFDAVARKQVLILSPWEYDPKKHRISRDECVALNNMAAEIATSLSAPSADLLSSIAPTDSRKKHQENTPNNHSGN